MLCVTGVDEFNNDNIDEGGNQVAFDFGNSANQINAGRRLFSAFGDQSNGESFCVTCSLRALRTKEWHKYASPLPVYESPNTKLLLVQLNHFNKHMNADNAIALWSMSRVYSCTSNLFICKKTQCTKAFA